MLAQVQAVLDQIAQAHVGLTHANGAGRAFELFLMTQIAEELQLRNYEISLIRSDGTRQSPGTLNPVFIQRGGAPGPIPSSQQGPNGPTAIAFRRAPWSLEWEIWNGVEFVGRSGGTHEIDIAIVPKELGDALRAEPTASRPLGHGWVSIECKDVQAAGTPDEMRAFISRIYDTTLLQAHRPHIGANGSTRRVYPINARRPGFGSGRVTYFQENRTTFGAIARATGFSRGTAALSTYYHVNRFQNLTVGSPEILDFRTELADWLEWRLPRTL